MTATVHAFPGAFERECPTCNGRAWSLIAKPDPHHAVFRCRACGHRLDWKAAPDPAAFAAAQGRASPPPEKVA